MAELNLLRDGEMVAKMSFPVDGFRSGAQKHNWGETVLYGYVAKNHPEARIKVEPTRSEDRLTGIKVVLRRDDEEITYMLVEPVANPLAFVNVFKIVVKVTRGKRADFVEWKKGHPPQIAEKIIGSNPFAALAVVKPGLPKK